MMERRSIIEKVVFLDTAGALENGVTLINESDQTNEQGIDELIFISQQRLVTEDI